VQPVLQENHNEESLVQQQRAVRRCKRALPRIILGVLCSCIAADSTSRELSPSRTTSRDARGDGPHAPGVNALKDEVQRLKSGGVVAAAAPVTAAAPGGEGYGQAAPASAPGQEGEQPLTPADALPMIQAQLAEHAQTKVESIPNASQDLRHNRVQFIL